MNYYQSNYYATNFYEADYYRIGGVVVLPTYNFFKNILRPVLREVTDEVWPDGKCC